MSVPLSSPDLVAIPTPAVPAPAPVKVPLSWLVEHGSPPLKYRSIMELADTTDVELPDLDPVRMAYSPAIRLAIGHAWDGSGPGGMLGVPDEKAGPESAGTILAVRRLLEYGWTQESPPLHRARRFLFRLLAEDNDPNFLFEFKAEARGNEAKTIHARHMLREASAAALAQAGYESDPRLRGAASRAMDRLREFLLSPLAEKPWVGTGAQRGISEEADPPSMHLLIMLAHMPVFRLEHHDTMEQLFAYLSKPLPRWEPRQRIGDDLIPAAHLALGDPIPHKPAIGADLAGALVWLETTARLGFLARHEAWSRLLERLLDERDRHGVWRGGRAGSTPPVPAQASVWPSYPLEEVQAEETLWTDVTFRLALVAKLAGRPLERI